MTGCSVVEDDERCDRTVLARGYCTKHYTRWRKHGDPHILLAIRHAGTTVERFWAKVTKTDVCWLWTAGANKKGYGLFRASGKSVLAHKFAWEQVNSPVPDDLFLDHECRTPICVRPGAGHLRLVTRKQNREHATGVQSNNTSGVPGVTWHKARGRWRAQVGHNGKYYSAGYFTAIEDAEAAVIAKRNELFTHNDLDRVAS